MGALYFRKLVHNQFDPFWKGRDYFINSKGHSAPGFYATLAVSGYFPIEEIKSLRGLDRGYKVIQYVILRSNKSGAYLGSNIQEVQRG